MQVVQPNPTRSKPRVSSGSSRSGALEVVHDDARTRGERRLHPWLLAKPEFDGLAGHEAGTNEHIRVRRVGAARYGCDHHAAVGQLGPCAVLERGGRRAAPGLLVRRAVARAESRVQALFRTGKRDLVLGPRRAREARHHGRQVELERLCENRLDLRGPHALFLRVRLDEGDVILGPAGEPQVREGGVVDREDAARRPVLGRHVGDGGPVLDGKARHPGPGEFDELPDHTVAPQDLGDGKNQIGRGRAARKLAGQAEPDDGRHEHGDRLPEHRGLCLYPADTPSEHAETVHHRRMRVGADEGVGEGPPVGCLENDPRQVLEVHLMAYPGPGRYHPDAVERLLCPLEQLVALHVPAVLDVDVGGEGRRETGGLGDDRVVDYELDRYQRIDAVGAPSERADRVAHRREVDDRGDTGQVLHQHPLGAEADLAARLCTPAGCARDRLDVGRVDVDAVLVAEQILEQHLQAERQTAPRRNVRPARRGGEC